MRAAIYARISDDRAGAGLGVARQRDDCLALAERRGHTVVDVYTDNDLSAYSGKPRPGYLAMLGHVKAGGVDVILAWHPDRLHRSPRELEDFIDLLDASGATVETVESGPLDLATPSGRMVARMLGATARFESEHKAARSRRKHEEIAQAGGVSGGGRRPFGYEADQVTVRPNEAALLADAARRVADGASLRSILVEWHRAGVVRPSGGPWTTRHGTVLRRALVSPRIVGLREHRGEVVGDAVWPAIVDRVTWERCRAVLSDPARRQGGRPPSYLLTGGLVVCARCGTALVCRPRQGRRRYACAADPGIDGCGGVAVMADPLEDEVRDQVLWRVGSGEVLAALAADQGDDGGRIAEQLRRDEDALQALEVDHYANGVLSRAGYLAARQQITARVAEARHLLARDGSSRALRGVADGGVTREDWDGGEVEWRRRLVSAVAERVKLGPAPVPGRNVFDPSRVAVKWRI